MHVEILIFLEHDRIFRQNLERRSRLAGAVGEAPPIRSVNSKRKREEIR